MLNLSLPFYKRIETISFLLLTIIGIINGQVTVFYIVYLFWFQELLRLVINLIYAAKYGKEDGTRVAFHDFFGGAFLLFIYLVFIVVLFGFMLNWNDRNLLYDNFRTLLFRNLYFNLSVLVFAVTYGFYRWQVGIQELAFSPFNKRHIILHISIILGAFIQMMVLKRFDVFFTANPLWGSALVIMPFLLLKLVMDKKELSP